MKKAYIIPIDGKVYHNRNGEGYRCTGNKSHLCVTRKQRALSLGEHIACMKRVKDGWTLAAHGVMQYEDGTIEWNYSAGGHFPR